MCLLAISCAAPASAAASPTITFIAPAGARTYADSGFGPAGYTEAPNAMRTSDQRPTIAIRADGGTQLLCHLDNLALTTPCGAPSPGCPTALCGTFQPSAALGPDSEEFTRTHFLAVDAMDADGNALSSVWLNIDVDTTPPTISVGSRSGVVPLADALDPPLRPRFSYQLGDSNLVGGNVDTAACSFTPASASPAFRPCAGQQGTNTIAPGRLARRHVLYRLQVRATDDFGRSSTSSGVYDPVPCTLSLRRVGSIASLLRSGIQTRLSCDTMRHVKVAVYAFMVNGDRSTSPRGAVSDNPILGEYNVSARTIAFTLTKRLRLDAAASQALRTAHSLSLVLAAGDPDKILAGIADDSLSYQSFTLRH